MLETTFSSLRFLFFFSFLTLFFCLIFFAFFFEALDVWSFFSVVFWSLCAVVDSCFVVSCGCAVVVASVCAAVVDVLSDSVVYSVAELCSVVFAVAAASSPYANVLLPTTRQPHSTAEQMDFMCLFILYSLLSSLIYSPSPKVHYNPFLTISQCYSPYFSYEP